MDQYKVLIGLEMHCEISKTKTKVFSSAKNSYTSIPNSNIRPVDMAFPGTLPPFHRSWHSPPPHRRGSQPPRGWCPGACR